VAPTAITPHTRSVRRAWIAGLLLAGPAWAAPTRTTPVDDPAATDFWREILEPHGKTVAAIIGNAKHALGKASDDDAPAQARQRAIRSAYQMLRHARTLAPENAEVLGLLGQAADELGQAPQAIDALEACIRVTGPERAGPEVTGRLGQLYLRLGRLDDAIRWLRYAQGPVAAADHATAAVYLATALAARGQMASAIDLLVTAVPGHTSYYTDPVTLVSFALAVHYDRDEQTGAAFEVLDRMQATLQQELGPFIQRALALIRFAPPEDRDYYQALLYEALGATTEARAEWALYAQISDAPWRARALQHIRLLDTQHRAPPASPHPAPVP
jgi:tetratricopeptide (TPR) repeat protein